RWYTETSEGLKVNEHTVQYDYDYQEFDPQSEEFARVMEGLAVFGFPLWYLRQSNVTPEDVEKVVGVQFFSENINADKAPVFVSGSTQPATPVEVIGTPTFGQRPLARAKGSVVRVTLESNNGSAIQYIHPGVNGLPTALIDHEGRAAFMSYYTADVEAPAAQRLGDDTAGLAQTAGAGWLGLLAKTTYIRGRNPDNKHCLAPYHLLFDDPSAACPTRADAIAHFTGTLGLPQEVAEAMVVPVSATPSAKLALEEVAYTYNELGYVAKTFTTSMEAGASVTYTHNHHGVPTQVVDELGTLTINDTDAYGNVIRRRVVDINGATVSDAHYQYDDEHRVLAECHDVTGSACSSVLDPFGPRVAFDAPRPSSASQTPGYLLSTYRYTPEGNLKKSKDAAGVTQVYEYNERSLPVSLDVSAPGEVARTRTMRYDARDRLTRLEHDAGGSLFETFEYDGLDRLVVHRDAAGVHHHFVYDTQGRLVAQRSQASRAPFAAGSALSTTSDPDRSERVIKRDGMGRVIETLEGHRSGDHVRETFTYDGDSLSPSSLSRNDGTSLDFGYDELGALRFTRDALGNISLSVLDTPARRDYSASIMRGPSDVHLTVVDKVQHRASLAGEVLATKIGTRFGPTVVGQTLEETTRVLLDAAGRPVRVTRPDGSITTTAYNLAGWVTRTSDSEEYGTTPTFDSTDITYNAFGLPTRIEDPSRVSQVTRYEYTGFGELRRRFYPANGPTEFFDEMTYDVFGRLATRKVITGAQEDVAYDVFSYAYDAATGRLDQIALATAGSSFPAAPSRRYEYDSLGRLTSASLVNTSPGMGLPDVEVTTEYDHDKLSRVILDRTLIDEGQGRVVASSVDHSFAFPDPLGRNFMSTSWSGGNGRSAVWEKHLDSAGRISFIFDMTTDPQFPPGSFTRRSESQLIKLDWLGERYAGRTHMVHNHYILEDPLLEARDFDPMGRVSSLRYDAIVLNDQDPPTPSNAAWGNKYCMGQTWSASSCAGPLYELSLAYDGGGRIVSRRARFESPRLDAAGTLAQSSQRPNPWQGFDYDGRGALSTEWINEAVDPTAYTNFISAAPWERDRAALENVASSGPGQQWEWERQQGTGSLTRIYDAMAPVDERWAHVDQAGALSDRLAGHALDHVQVDGATHRIVHDHRGRVVSSSVENDRGFWLTFDAHDLLANQRGRLSAAQDEAITTKTNTQVTALTILGGLILVLGVGLSLGISASYPPEQTNGGVRLLIFAVGALGGGAYFAVAARRLVRLALREVLVAQGTAAVDGEAVTINGVTFTVPDGAFTDGTRYTVYYAENPTRMVLSVVSD
ncbi:MAG: hypothetical protein AAGI01_06700, partial [Myxococcota bacterium]